MVIFQESSIDISTFSEVGGRQSGGKGQRKERDRGRGGGSMRGRGRGRGVRVRGEFDSGVQRTLQETRTAEIHKKDLSDALSFLPE